MRAVLIALGVLVIVIVLSFVGFRILGLVVLENGCEEIIQKEINEKNKEVSEVASFEILKSEMFSDKERALGFLQENNANNIDRVSEIISVIEGEFEIVLVEMRTAFDYSKIDAYVCQEGEVL